MTNVGNTNQPLDGRKPSNDLANKNDPNQRALHKKKLAKASSEQATKVRQQHERGAVKAATKPTKTADEGKFTKYTASKPFQMSKPTLKEGETQTPKECVKRFTDDKYKVPVKILTKDVPNEILQKMGHENSHFKAALQQKQNDPDSSDEVTGQSDRDDQDTHMLKKVKEDKGGSDSDGGGSDPQSDEEVSPTPSLMPASGILASTKIDTAKSKAHHHSDRTSSSTNVNDEIETESEEEALPERVQGNEYGGGSDSESDSQEEDDSSSLLLSSGTSGSTTNPTAAELNKQNLNNMIASEQALLDYKNSDTNASPLNTRAKTQLTTLIQKQKDALSKGDTEIKKAISGAPTLLQAIVTTNANNTVTDASYVKTQITSIIQQTQNYDGSGVLAQMIASENTISKSLTDPTAKAQLEKLIKEQQEDLDGGDPATINQVIKTSSTTLDTISRQEILSQMISSEEALKNSKTLSETATKTLTDLIAEQKTILNGRDPSAINREISKSSTTLGTIRQTEQTAPESSNKTKSLTSLNKIIHQNPSPLQPIIQQANSWTSSNEAPQSYDMTENPDNFQSLVWSVSPQAIVAMVLNKVVDQLAQLDLEMMNSQVEMMKYQFQYAEYQSSNTVTAAEKELEGAKINFGLQMGQGVLSLAMAHQGLSWDKDSYNTGLRERELANSPDASATLFEEPSGGLTPGYEERVATNLEVDESISVGDGNSRSVSDREKSPTKQTFSRRKGKSEGGPVDTQDRVVAHGSGSDDKSKNITSTNARSGDKKVVKGVKKGDTIRPGVKKDGNGEIRATWKEGDNLNAYGPGGKKITLEDDKPVPFSDVAGDLSPEGETVMDATSGRYDEAALKTKIEQGERFKTAMDEKVKIKVTEKYKETAEYQQAAKSGEKLEPSEEKVKDWSKTEPGKKAVQESHEEVRNEVLTEEGATPEDIEDYAHAERLSGDDGFSDKDIPKIYGHVSVQGEETGSCASALHRQTRGKSNPAQNRKELLDRAVKPSPPGEEGEAPPPYLKRLMFALLRAEIVRHWEVLIIRN